MTTRGSKPAGYTMVEVMVALAVLAVGATGVIALQKATLIGNTHARNISIASAIARTWAERLRTDALQWNDPGEVPDLANDTDWLKQLGNPAYPDRVIPTSIADLGSPVTDVLGTDVYVTDPSDPAYVETAFCTHLRFRQFEDPINTGETLWPQLIRVEIRVLWERNGDPIDCSTLPSVVDPLPDRYGAVYLTTSVLQNMSSH
ncbi:MAG: prepilin-type N-terminal cleavage/methylation domain-containing protein [Polyangiaceae bacterium]|nr:prepilin-type N-terminal cleavage/methylation domain-containing protein [Polyangiaceae bacterium]